MRNIFFALALVICCCGAATAQKGVAESGFYPSSYVGGETWTGEVTTVDEEKQEITLTYRDGKNVSTFTGVLIKDYMGPMNKKGVYEQVKLPLLLGYHVRAYCMSKSKKGPDGVKVKTNYIHIIKIVKAK